MMVPHNDLPIEIAVASMLLQEMEYIERNDRVLFNHIMVHHTTIRKHC